MTGENAGDKFGAAVSLNTDGNYVVIGAPEHDGVAAGTNWGRAYVYYNSDLDAPAGGGAPLAIISGSGIHTISGSGLLTVAAS